MAVVYQDAGVCENNDHRHKEPYIAICVSYRILWVGTHVAIWFFMTMVVIFADTGNSRTSVTFNRVRFNGVRFNIIVKIHTGRSFLIVLVSNSSHFYVFGVWVINTYETRNNQVQNNYLVQGPENN